jgi:hypothetical protein
MLPILYGYDLLFSPFLHLLHDKHKYAFVCIYSGMLLVVIGGWMRERSVCVFLDELQKCTLLLL